MKKTLVFLLVVFMGVFLLTGCLTKEKVEEPANDNISVNEYSVGDVKSEIKENYINGTAGWDTADPDVVPLRNLKNVIVVYDGSDYGYVYGVTSDGTGLYFKVNTNLEIKDTFNATGRPYFTERDQNKGYFEYRFSIAQSDSEVATTVKGNIPWDKADYLTMDNLPGMNNLGNLVIFEGKYLGKDNYGHFDFDLNNDGNSDVKVVKYSLMPALIENNTYEVKGVVGYNYGFKIYVGDSSFVTEK
ncbi:hypothetical protein [Marinitoga lauensis]|uniref:hypothetical protein n=1 Tax=Marinitoga lauensis TaxID=2201189 RepID=UPI001010BC3C|nr:hypothetical protein [Marinitoga lauensis]